MKHEDGHRKYSPIFVAWVVVRYLFVKLLLTPLLGGAVKLIVRRMTSLSRVFDVSQRPCNLVIEVF